MAVADQYEFRIGQVLGQSFSILMKNIVPFGAIALLFSSPALIYNLSIDPYAVDAGNVGVGAVAIGIVSLLLTYVIMAALVYGTIQQLRGRDSSLGEIIGRGLALMFPVLGLAIIAGLAIGLGMLLLIVPGIILAVMWWVAIPVAVIERPGVFASLGRSAELTKGNRWKIVGIILIVLVLQFVATFIVAFIVGMVVAMAGDATGASLTAGVIVEWISTAFFSAFFAVIGAVGYYHLRGVREGVDIEEVAAVFD